MSLRAWLAACRGYRDKIGGGSGGGIPPMTGKELRELMEQYPDDPSAPSFEAVMMQHGTDAL